MRFVPTALVLVSLLNLGWVGTNPKPLQQSFSKLSPKEGGKFLDLSNGERKELVWMAKAASSAYDDEQKPLGYRSISHEEWRQVAQDCPNIHYTQDGLFTVGASGLRGRIMINMMNEGRIILALSGCDAGKGFSEGLKDIGAVLTQNLWEPRQYEESLRLMKGVIARYHCKELWIVGHSLGGSLTTYLALHLPDGRTNVKCATFNGLTLAKKLCATGNQALAERRLRNVYCRGDFAYNFIFGGRHFGPSYMLSTETDNMGIIERHSVDTMVRLMVRDRTAWQGL